MTDHSVTAIPAADLRRARRVFLLVAVAAPLLLTALATALILAWLPELPNPAATHWGVDGVNGFAAPITYVWLALGIGLGLPLLLAIVTLAAVREQWGGAARLLGALALGLAGFSAVITVGSVAIQRGLADAATVGPIGGVLIAAAVVLVVLGVLGWLVQPHVGPIPAAPLQPAHLAAISAGERVAWVATATMSRAVMIGIGLVVLFVVGITAAMVVAASEGAWIPVLTLLIIGLAFASSASYRVRVGPDGLVARSQLGFPRIRVPLDEITAVRAVDCHPFGEFGGFGWRIGLDGRTGIVLRSGPAIEVQRRDRRPLIVTVDGAEVGAAVLQAYLDRAGTAPGTNKRGTNERGTNEKGTSEKGTGS